MRRARRLLAGLVAAAALSSQPLPAAASTSGRDASSARHASDWVWQVGPSKRAADTSARSGAVRCLYQSKTGFLSWRCYSGERAFVSYEFSIPAQARSVQARVWMRDVAPYMELRPGKRVTPTRYRVTFAIDQNLLGRVDRVVLRYQVPT